MQRCVCCAVVVGLLLFSCGKSALSTKINGVSFVAYKIPVDSSHTEPIGKINANYAAVMPFGFIKDITHPDIVHNTDKQWFGETRAGAKQYIETLQKQGLKIMIKPQIWVWHGAYTGTIKMPNEAAWKALETSYTDFILEYVSLAEETSAELFCIGTELELFIKHRPEYWLALIENIKTVYKGKLTYAANWNEFEATPFWDALDFIGIDAYFPVSQQKTPTVAECLGNWKVHKKIIKQLSEKYKTPILFTEYGYRSVDYSGKAPWNYDRKLGAVNLQAQVNTTEALFKTFWHEDWFAGGFVWKWFIEYNEVGGNENTMFTPQNKPVEATIKYYYGQ